ncbi:MAG: hypothetical protein IPQ27_11685 [Chitinophagaceae bacterium]|nr:hypothetical protein [Chitinophagaceae bacterium]
MLQTINDIVVQGGGSANVNISGTDPGDVLNLSVSGLPSFAVFTPTGNVQDQFQLIREQMMWVRIIISV